MSPMNDKALGKRDSKRNLPAELIEALREMKAGGGTMVTRRVKVSPITEARNRSGLSRAGFAKALNVSPRTLQAWEQGRRKPSGAARSLLAIAVARPEVVREVLAGK